MSDWPSTRARQVLAALLKIGWTVKRQAGSHRTLYRGGWPDFVLPSTILRRLGRGYEALGIGRRELKMKLPLLD